jgi:hypothetical protein
MLAAVLAIAMVGGATWAMAQSSGQVSACVDRKGKVSALGFEDENFTCDPDKETKITWSITGPPGADGSPGLFDVYVVETTQTLPPNEFVQGRALCELGDRATGGGYSVHAPNLIPIFRSFPVSNPPVAWGVDVINLDNIDRTITVFAVCADITR